MDEAYQALRLRDYGRAISLMQRAIEASPQRISIRKDLAYTLLKTGETLAARDQFREAMKLDSNDVEAALEGVPCKTNPLGVKGIGESGTIGAPPAVINALIDALAPLGVDAIDMPATPLRVWETIRKAKGKSAAA